jgi:hypothetical protein
LRGRGWIRLNGEGYAVKLREELKDRAPRRHFSSRTICPSPEAAAADEISAC